MKKKDLAIIILVIGLSAIFSYFLSSKLFANPKDRKLTVEVVEPISSDFTRPSEKYFNKDSVDPTQLIQIGDNNNNQPFNKK